MRPPLSVALLLGAFLLDACGSQSADSKAPPPPPPPPRASDFVPTARVTVTDGAGAAGPFAVGNVDLLTLAVEGGSLSPGDHAVRVDVLGPAGALYAQLPATLTAGEDGTGAASVALQVRGTTIDAYRQVGTWRLAANIDGIRLANASVELTE